MRKLWDCGFPAAAQVHSIQTLDNYTLCLPGVHGKQRLESRCPIATQLCTRISVRAILTAVHSNLTDMHTCQTTVHSCQTAVHSRQTAVHTRQTAVHTRQTAVHSRQTAVHMCQTTVHMCQIAVHRCVSYGTAAFQPQRRCTVFKPLTITRFACRVCTVNSGWKAAVP